MKIVTRILLNFLIILVLSVTTIGFLIYELTKAGKELSESQTRYIITTKSVEAEKTMGKYEIKMLELMNALQKGEQDSASKIYINEIVSKMFFFKEHIKFIKQNVAQGERNYIAEMEQINEKWDPIKSKLYEQIQDNNLTMAYKAANNLNESMTEFNIQLNLLNAQIKTIA